MTDALDGQGSGENRPDPALSAFNYSPPVPASGVSQDVAAQQDMRAQIAAAVAQALAAREAEVAAAAQPKVLSPEEDARARLDLAGVGLGVEERLAELYKVLHLLATKVGV